MRTTVTLLALLAGCDGATDGNTKDDDGIFVDPDDILIGDSGVEVDTDTDTDADTVDTVDTDTPVIETADTFVFADTDIDTDSPPDDTAELPTGTTIPNIRDGIHNPGQTLHIPDLVVTALRVRVQPPGTNGFSVQDPTEPYDAGLYVNLLDGNLAPEVGDIVDITGLYEEWPVSGTFLWETQSRLKIHSSVPNSSWVKTGTASLPAPVVVTLAELQSFLDAERYESMIVTLEEAEPLDVVLNPLRSGPGEGEFEVTLSGVSSDLVRIKPWFFDLRDLYDVDVGDRLESVTGMLWYDVNGYKVSPRSTLDVPSYLDL